MKLKVIVDLVDDNNVVDVCSRQGVSIVLNSDSLHDRQKAMNDAFGALNMHMTQMIVNQAVSSTDTAKGK